MAASRYFSDLRLQYKKDSQPCEPDMAAFKPIVCAFGSAPNPLEGWLSSGHGTSSLVHKGW